MISRFFIDRPIFAAVLSIVITLGGAISVFRLPLAQFPRISPPNVAVRVVPRVPAPLVGLPGFIDH